MKLLVRVEKGLEEGDFSAGFRQWLNFNEIIWHEYEEIVARLIKKGRKHFSSMAIIDYIRLNTALNDTDIMFKINNNTAPDLSRFYMLVHPEHDGFFELRRRP